MKKTLFILVSIITAAGCSLERQPMNGPSSATFPASEEEALAGVYAAYKGLTLEDLQSTTFPYRIEDDATDIGSYRVGNENLIKQMNGTLTSESYPPRWIYEDIYQVAGRVHLVLDNLDRLKGVCDEQTIAQFRAELLCIRALQSLMHYATAWKLQKCFSFIQMWISSYSRLPRPISSAWASPASHSASGWFKWKYS